MIQDLYQSQANPHPTSWDDGFSALIETDDDQVVLMESLSCRGVFDNSWTVSSEAHEYQLFDDLDEASKFAAELVLTSLKRSKDLADE
jgi:hypothetical protein